MGRLFIERVKWLNLPVDQYIVVGSGLLDVLGIRRSNDIDLVVDEALYDKLRGLPGYVEDSSLDEERLLYRGGEAELWKSWPTMYGRWRIGDFMSGSEIINGVRFITLDFLRQWKVWHDQPKDRQDIALIDAYLGANL